MSLFFSATANKKATAAAGVGLVDSGFNFTYLVSGSSGRLYSWASNSFGQLGINSLAVGSNTPVSVLGAVKTFCKIAAGVSTGAAITNSGRAWGWGYNGNGSVGDNTTVSKLTPVSVLGAVKTFCQISVGKHTMAIDKNGRAWGWGYNGVGCIGDNTITNRLTPVSVLGAVKTFCQISAGYNFTVALTNGGRAWGWGNNGYRQLGDNSVVLSRITPVSVAGTVKTFCQISAGNYNLSHTMAVDKNGRVWAWGDNTYGQIGDNTTTVRGTPVSILGAVKTFCKISAGAGFAAAIDKNGRAWTWGLNTNGQLGDNSVISKLTPISVLGVVKTFCEISCGAYYVIAINKNGRVWGWGGNSGAEIGANSAALSILTPVRVFNL